MEWTDEQQEEINKIVTSRLARQKTSLLNSLGFSSVEEATSAWDDASKRVSSLTKELEERKQEIEGLNGASADVNALTKELQGREKQIEELTKQLEERQKELSDYSQKEFRGLVTAEAKKLGFMDSAIDDVVLYAGQQEDLSGEKLEGWLKELAEEKEHWVSVQSTMPTYPNKPSDKESTQKFLQERLKVKF